MIITVTMNPAMDKTISISEFVHGGLNRIVDFRIDAGGKGINVSKTLQELGKGANTLALGFLAGKTGENIIEILEAQKIAHDFIFVEGETRTNIKMVENNGIVTEINESGPEITEEQICQLIEKIESYSDENTLVVLAGSVPKGVNKYIYKEITEAVHKKGAAVLLDADGELFQHALEARPDIVKPNHIELCSCKGVEPTIAVEELVKLAKEIMEEKGIPMAAVSMGSKGAIFLIDGKECYREGIPVECKSTVGAGDAMVAAIAYSWENNLSEKRMMDLCMAVSAGAVATDGTTPPSMEMVESLMRNL